MDLVGLTGCLRVQGLAPRGRSALLFACSGHMEAAICSQAQLSSLTLEQVSCNKLGPMHGQGMAAVPLCPPEEWRRRLLLCFAVSASNLLRASEGVSESASASSRRFVRLDLLVCVLSL